MGEGGSLGLREGLHSSGAYVGLLLLFFTNLQMVYAVTDACSRGFFFFFLEDEALKHIRNMQRALAEETENIITKKITLPPTCSRSLGKV